MTALLTILVVISVGAVLRLLSGVLIPLAVAFFLSYMAMPVVRWGKRLHVPVMISLIVVLLAFTALLAGLGQVVYSSGMEFVDQLPEIVEEGRDLIVTVLASFGLDDDQIQKILPKDQRLDIKKLLEYIPGATRFARGGIEALFTGVSFSILVLLFMVFIVLDRGNEFLDRRIVAAFSKEGTESAAPILKEVHAQIERYILTKTAISLLTGVLVTVTLMLFGIPYAALFGVVSFLLNFIPNVGSIIAVIPPVLVALATLPTPLQAIPILISLTVIQFGVGNLLEPMIFSKQLSLNPITVLVALVLWGVLWGVWGMVLAIPITAVIRIIMETSPAGQHLAVLMRGD